MGTHAVEISEFVPIEAIDPVYFDKTYYLAPDKGASKPYALLTEALKETKRCAVGRWAAKGKAYIVILRPVDGILVMQQLRFAAEVRPASEVDVAKTEVKPAELKLARQLIDQQQADMFDPTTYVDEVRGRVEAAIQKKVEGQEISVSEAPVESKGKVIDLMEALRASLEKTEAARASTSKLGARKSAKRVEEPKSGGEARRRAEARGPQVGQAVITPGPAMQSYSVRDVERLLRLSRSTIQGLIKGGFVKPTRGPRRQYRFSFQDLIVLRTARALDAGQGAEPTHPPFSRGPAPALA